MRIVPSEDYDESDLAGFEQIQDELIDTYGEPDLVGRFRQARVNKSIAICNWIISGNRYHLNEINHFERQIQEWAKELKKGMSINQALIYISRDFAGGRPINEKEITVRQYFDYLKEYERENKKK